MAHPSNSKETEQKQSGGEKEGGFAEGYGAVDAEQLSVLLAADEEFNASFELARINPEAAPKSSPFTEELAHSSNSNKQKEQKHSGGEKGSLFTKELAHPSNTKQTEQKQSGAEKGAGFAEGYGTVDAEELSVLLAADEQFNASFDLAKINAENEQNR